MWVSSLTGAQEGGGIFWGRPGRGRGGMFLHRFDAELSGKHHVPREGKKCVRYPKKCGEPMANIYT